MQAFVLLGTKATGDTFADEATARLGRDFRG
jgi:hypothetical protein